MIDASYEPLPGNDHVARFCRQRFITEDGKVAAVAFIPRKDEKYLSVQWVEYLEDISDCKGIEAVRDAFSKKFKMRPSEIITFHHVDNTCRHILDASHIKIRMLHVPNPHNPAHSGIFGIDQYPELIAELITETIQEQYPAI